MPNSLPGLSAADGQPRQVLGADDREVHAGGQPQRLARPLGRAQADQAGVVAARRGRDRLGQGGGERRRVERAAHRAEHQLAGQRELLFDAGQRMLRPGLARQALQQRGEAGAQVGMRLGAGRLGGAGLDEAVERRLVVGGKARRQGHVGRRDAVDHGAPHGLGKLAQHLERDPRAVGAADQVDALGAELAPHRVEVLDRDRRGEEAEVAFGLEVGLLQQRRLALRDQALLALGLGLLGEGLVFRVLAGQRRRAAGAALVDEDDVAPVVQPGEQRHHLRRQRDRALPRAAGEEEHRVGELPARQRRHDDVVDLHAAALGMLGIERPLDLAAQHAVAKAGDVAFASTRPAPRRRPPRRAAPRARPAAVAAAAASERRRRELIRRGFA